MSGLLPGAEQLRSDRRGGGTYVDGVPWRFTGHTTEVVPRDIAGARSMAERHEYPPHLWVWPEKRWIGQTVPFDRSAFALHHPAGTPHTNKMRAIQAEIIGYAAETPDWPLEWWEWIGREVLRPIVDLGYPINLERVAPTTGGDGYGVDGKVRMSRAAWAAFDGVCCHANVPDNSHWDIGAGRLDLIAQAARPPQGDPFMALTDEKQDELYKMVEVIRDRLATPAVLDGKPADSRSVVERRVSAIYLALPELMQGRADVDEAALAAALVDSFDDALAAAVADELDRRARARLDVTP